MNLTCTDCGQTFRITADQLGTRGKCPHCRATIILPRAARRDRVTGEIHAPGIWTERWLSLLGTGFLHLLVLAVLALVPWRDMPADFSGEGHLVMTGVAPNARSPVEVVEPEPDQSLADSSRRRLELFELQPDPSSAHQSASATGNSLEIPSPGEVGNFQQDAEEFWRARPGDDDEFGMLLDQLRKDGLEIVITFDSTGSMEGEIEEVKRKIERMGNVLFQLVPRTRISVCTYRDHDARYLVKGQPLTDDLAEITGFLSGVTAAGGGDDPEAVQAGLQWAIGENRFREGARKIVLLFGDSPPHTADLDECLLLVSEFRREQRGTVSTVTCHSNRRLAAFDDIARLGGGESFLARDEREIMTQLLVLVFGSQHREKVLEAFNLLHR